MADVELVEHESSARAAPRPRRSRRLRLPALGALVALVLGLLAAQAVVDARERDRATRLAQVPGVLAPVRPDAQQLWRGSPSDVPTPPGFVPVLVGDALLTGAVEADGTVRLGAVDPETGRRLWSTVEAAPAGTLQDGPFGTINCRVAAGPAPAASSLTTAACTAVLPTDLVELARTASAAAFADSRAVLLLVDTATGEVIERVDPPPGTDVEDAPGGYLTATQEADGADTVARWEWGSASPTWTSHLALPPGAELAPGAPGTLAMAADRVAHSRAGTAWLLDATDGSLVDAATGTRGDSAVADLLPSGTFLASWFGGADPTSRMIAADGTVAVLPGLVGLAPLVDDGSAAGLVLAAEVSRNGSPRALVALDARTGERRWRSAAALGWSVIVLDGVACASDGSSLVAVDVRDGSTRWTRTIGRSETELLTDGTLAIVAGRGRVDAYDLRDGEPAWTSVVVHAGDSTMLEPADVGATPDAQDTSGRAAAVGRHLALVSPSGEITVLG